MTIETGIERLAALVLTITALSHIAAPRAWHVFFTRTRALGELAGFVNAAIHIPLGLLITAFHEVWTWPGVAVTVMGWALLAKGTVHLMVPALAERTLGLPGEGQAAERTYRLFGLAMMPVAAFLWWIALR